MSRKTKGFDYVEAKKLWKLRFTENNKRYTVYGGTKKECEEKKADLLEKLKQHMHLENQKITLAKFYELWVEEQAKEVKPSTIWNYQKSWVHIKDRLGSRKISSLVKSDVLQLQHDMKKSCSADTINRTTKLLSQILNAAVVDRIIIFNPCTGIKTIKTNRPKATDTCHRALTEEETQMFFKYAEESYYYNLLRFLLKTGCRIGEATALTWFDVNFKKSEIKISKTTCRVSNTKYVISDTPKTESSIRTIPITAEVNAILEAQKTQNCMLFGSMQPLIFPNTKNEVASHNTVGNCIKDIIRKINSEENTYFSEFSPHALRDTFATRCIEQGMNPNTLKSLLGHSSLKMTMDLYAHVMPNTKHAELAKISFAV